MSKAIIFDFNGVFVLSEYLSDRFKKDFSVESSEFIAALKDVLPILRKPNSPTCYSLFLPYLQKWDVSLNEEKFLAYWFSGEKMDAEVVKYALNLHNEGIKIIVLSNNFKERTDYYRSAFTDFFAWVDGANFSWETGFVKPDQKAYTYILKKYGLKAEGCIYFDDSKKNVQAAEELGIKSFKYPGFKRAKEIISSFISES